MIETRRLRLRAPEARDRAPMHAMMADPRVMADLAPVRSPKETDAVLARHDAMRGDGLGFFVVERLSDDEFIGFCGLKRGDANTPVAGEIEAGWCIAAQHWRRGYALEAMSAVLEWGWQRFVPPRIVAIAAARNAASRHLMARLGMSHLQNADFESDWFAAGHPLRSSVTYAIYPPDDGGSQ